MIKSNDNTWYEHICVLINTNDSCNCKNIMTSTTRQLGKTEGILPKGPYPPCLRMAERAILAGYPRYVLISDSNICIPHPRCRHWGHPSPVAALAVINTTYIAIKWRQLNIGNTHLRVKNWLQTICPCRLLGNIGREQAGSMQSIIMGVSMLLFVYATHWCLASRKGPLLLTDTRIEFRTWTNNYIATENGIWLLIHDLNFTLMFWSSWLITYQIKQWKLLLILPLISIDLCQKRWPLQTLNWCWERYHLKSFASNWYLHQSIRQIRHANLFSRGGDISSHSTKTRLDCDLREIR